MDIIDAIANHKSRHGIPWVAGADWNMDPTEIDKAGILGSLQASARIPDNAETCVSPSCVRTLDYFVMDRKLADGAGDALTIMDANTRPRRPVQFRFLAGLKGAQEDYLQEGRSAPHRASDRAQS